MKDITLTGKFIKRELIIISILSIISYALNIFSIAYFETEWTELYSSLFLVVAFAVVVYFLLIPFRIVLNLLINLFGKKSK